MQRTTDTHHQLFPSITNYVTHYKPFPPITNYFTHYNLFPYITNYCYSSQTIAIYNKLCYTLQAIPIYNKVLLHIANYSHRTPRNLSHITNSNRAADWTPPADWVYFYMKPSPAVVMLRYKSQVLMFKSG